MWFSDEVNRLTAGPHQEEGASSGYVDLDSILMSGLEDEGDFKRSFV